MKPDKTLFPKGQIAIFIITGFFILAIPFILSFNNPWFSLNDTGLANMGTALSITAPFIGIGSSILVYMAFRVQFRANQEINEKFEKQSDDQLFFKIIEGLTDKIKSATIIDRDQQHIGIQAYFYVIKEFNTRISQHTYEIGYDIITNNSETIDLEIFQRFCRENNATNWQNPEQLSKHLKGNITSADALLSNIHGYTDNIVKSIGRKYFYECDYELRRQTYIEAYRDLYKRFAGVLDSYFTNVHYLLNFIHKHKSNELYIGYFKDNLTTVEKTLIFYYCATMIYSSNFIQLTRELKIIDDVERYFMHLYQMDSIDKASFELEDILAEQ